jgi:hypothetical protein
MANGASGWCSWLIRLLCWIEAPRHYSEMQRAGLTFPQNARNLSNATPPSTTTMSALNE